MTTLGAKLSISDIKKMKAYDGKGYDINTEFALPDTAEQEIEKPSETSTVCRKNRHTYRCGAWYDRS